MLEARKSVRAAKRGDKHSIVRRRPPVIDESHSYTHHWRMLVLWFLCKQIYSVAKQMSASSSSTTGQSEHSSSSTETLPSPSSSSSELLETVLDPLVAERIARLKLLRKLQEYERRCSKEGVEVQCRLIENGLLAFIASTALIEQLAGPSLRTLLVLLEDKQEEEKEEDDSYYQNYIEPHVSTLLPVLLR